MSLLATPTFAGVDESETFYVRQGAPQVSGVSSVQSIVGAVGITSSDSSLTVSVVGQDVDLELTGNNIAPAAVAATGAISSATTITATGLLSGGSINTAGAITATGSLSAGAITSTALTTSVSFVSQTTVFTTSGAGVYTFSSAEVNLQGSLFSARISFLPNVAANNTSLFGDLVGFKNVDNTYNWVWYNNYPVAGTIGQPALSITGNSTNTPTLNFFGASASTAYTLIITKMNVK
jgi:hypothetical protein